MKKTLLTFGVLAAVICCTLAYAVTKQNALKPSGTSSVSNDEPSSMTVDSNEVSSLKPERGLQIDPGSVVRAFSQIPCTKAKRAVQDSTSNIGNVENVVVDVWNSEPEIFPMNDGCAYDISTNTITIEGLTDSSNWFITGVNDGGYYGWYAVGNRKYKFSGTLTSNGEITVLPCILYYTENGLSIANNTTVYLNESNGFTLDFEVTATEIPDGVPVILGFLSGNDTEATLLTSTDNKFYYTYKTSVAQEWTSDNNLPGLGLDNFSSGTYTVRLEDGVTTLGLYYNGTLYVTGINTTAEEVVLPDNITVGNIIKQIDYFGYNNRMDWSGAPDLKVLDATKVTKLYSPFNDSAITDLYIGNNTSFYTRPSGVENVYLHIPYGVTRSKYSSYNFKRILIGEEQPQYPVTSNSDWVIAGKDEGDYFGITTYDNYFAVKEIFTEKESIELPFSTPYSGGREYYLSYFGNDGSSNSYLCQNAPVLTSVTVLESYKNVRVNWSYCPIRELHVQGDVLNTNWNLPSNMTVYVGNQAYYNNLENSSSWNKAILVPEGWEFEWMTVNVGRKGEFAQTYIEMTDADWSLGMYVKVTGTLNATDLANIKNLTNLRKLDLSEAEFTSLPNNFLESKSSLMEVYLPATLTSIPQAAFQYCYSLSSVSAPGVTSIGSSAFYNCSHLTDFDLSKVSTVNQSAFYYCSSFNPTDLSSLKSIGSNAFYNTAVREVTLSEGITAIGESVFSNCTRLTKVTLPNTVTSLASNAFNRCTSLTSINLPEGITSIGSNAFYYCYSLKEITLPSTVQSIGYSVFDNCVNLGSIKCKAIVPPVVNGDFLSNVDLNHCTLYIAPFAIDAYRSADYWNVFYIMKALDEPVKNIYINRPMTFDLLSEDNAVLQDNPNLTLDYGNSYSTVGQLTASGDGTLSAGIFTLYHSFGQRQSSSITDYRTTLINNAENMRADSVLCSISFEKNRWHFISFQYDVQMSDIYGLNSTDFVIRKYNSYNRAMGDGTTSNWETVPADGVLEAGKGYIIQAANNTTNVNGNSRLAVVRFPSRNTVTKNKLFTSNNVIVPLEEYPAEFAHNRSWNLVGNPYPCYYDMRYLMDDFTTPVVLWRGTSYQAYSPVDDYIILRPNEAFFVQRPLDAEEMVFSAEGRMHYLDAYYYSNYYDITPGIYYAPSRNVSENPRSVFNFNISGCGTDDRARIVLNEEASMDYELNCDASKFFAENSVGAEIYVAGNIKYDICERPLADGTATLGTRIGTDGEYTISLSGRNIEGWTVMLTDKQTGKTVDLSVESYTFNAEAGTDADRFIITFAATDKTTVEEVDKADVTGKVRIVNAAGMTVFNGDLDEFKASAAPGVYIVVSAEKSYKIVVK